MELMANSKDYILYSYFRSSASYRVRIALGLKGIQYEYRAVHLLNHGGEQLSASYKELNPSQEVPTLVHKGNIVAQSVAILDYLDRVAPGPRLFPEDPHQRALVMQACEIVNSGIQPVHNLRVLKALGEQFGANEEQKKDWAVRWLNYGMTTLESFLKPHAGKFCFGDTLTAADCFLIPCLVSADRYAMTFDAYPTLTRIRRNCDELTAFTEASPTNVPDAPKS
jgi:maleylacetoacetate isomerase